MTLFWHIGLTVNDRYWLTEFSEVSPVTQFGRYRQFQIFKMAAAANFDFLIRYFCPNFLTDLNTLEAYYGRHYVMFARAMFVHLFVRTGVSCELVTNSP